MRGPLFFLISSLAFTATGAAQSPGRDSVPAHYSVLSAHGAVRVLQFAAGPGARSEMHSHPPHWAYVIRPGLLRFSYPNGRSIDVPVRAGQQFEIPRPLTHTVEVLGTDSVVVILVEYPADSTPPRR